MVEGDWYVAGCFDVRGGESGVEDENIYVQGGENLEEARKKVGVMGLEMPFHGTIDHAILALSDKVRLYFVF